MSLRRRLGGEAGFTLVELLTTVAVSSVVFRHLLAASHVFPVAGLATVTGLRSMVAPVIAGGVATTLCNARV